MCGKCARSEVRVSIRANDALLPVWNSGKVASFFFPARRQVAADFAAIRFRLRLV